MRTISVVLDFAESERRLSDLCPLSIRNCTAVALQADKNNTEDIMFGSNGACLGWLEPNKSTLLPITSLTMLSLAKAIDPNTRVVIHTIGCE